MPYAVNELFVSIQGEGRDVGLPAIFIRFSGCNLKCSFCDTDHEVANYVFETPEELVTAISKLEEVFPARLARLVVLTGGEPLLQVDLPLINALVQAGLFPCLETNGSLGAVSQSPLGDRLIPILTRYFHTVSVSPKSRSIDFGLLRTANCLKVVWPTEVFSDAFLETMYVNLNASSPVSTDRKWAVLQPMTVGAIHDLKTRRNCLVTVAKVQLLRKQGQVWRAVPQMHVAMGIK